MYYATEVNSLTMSLRVYLPSQYGYPNERNFTANPLNKREKFLK